MSRREELNLLSGVHPGLLRNNRRICARAVGRRAQFYAAREYKAARAALEEELRQARGGEPPVEGPVEVQVATYWPRRHRQGPANGLALGDVDASLKGILDALEGADVLGDDAQVVRLLAAKELASGLPGILVRVYSLGAS